MDKNTFIELAKETYRLTLLFPKKEPLRNKLREAADGLIFEFIMEENDYAGNMRRLFEVMASYLEIAADQDWVAPAKIAAVDDAAKRIKQELGEDESFNPAELENIVCQAERETLGNELPQDAAPIAGKDFILVPEKEAAPKMSLPLTRDLMESKMPSVPMIADVFAASEQGAAPASGADGGQTALTAAQIARQNRIMEFLKEKGRAQVWEIQNIFPSVSKRTIRRDFCAMLEQGLIERTGERNTTAYKPKVNLA